MNWTRYNITSGVHANRLCYQFNDTICLRVRFETFFDFLNARLNAHACSQLIRTNCFKAIPIIVGFFFLSINYWNFYFYPSTLGDFNYWKCTASSSTVILRLRRTLHSARFPKRIISPYLSIGKLASRVLISFKEKNTNILGWIFFPEV